nr:DUF1778 domain-containing protein [uncultured Halomonas sp.]
MKPDIQTPAKMQPLNMRVESRKRALIDRAVAELGGDRTSFVIDAACKRAEEVLLDRRVYMLDDEAFDFFERAIEQPVQENACLQNLLNREPTWRSRPQKS